MEITDAFLLREDNVVGDVASGLRLGDPATIQVQFQDIFNQVPLIEAQDWSTQGLTKQYSPLFAQQRTRPQPRGHQRVQG